MVEDFIVDAHTHTGYPGVFFTPEQAKGTLPAVMDRLNIRFAVCTSQDLLYGVDKDTLDREQALYEESNGRIFFLGIFDPRRDEESLRFLRAATKSSGFAGLKIHPSIHGIPASDPSYEPAWRFADEHHLPILTHSWSVSDYNPVQRLSTPGQFEPMIEKFPHVPFVLAHAGGRGSGRHEAIRLACDYPNVFLDFAGDIFCYGLIESLVAAVPPEKILFGSDYPWIDPRCHLTRVLVAEIGADVKRKILRENALRVYRLGGSHG